jgi:AraC-like DNA-binding protein
MRVALGVACGGDDENVEQSAFTALQHALRQERELCFGDEAEPARPLPKYSDLTRAVDRLIDAFERVALGEAMIAGDDFVRTLSAWADGRSGAIRDQLLVALAAVAKAVARRNVLSPDVADHFIDDVCQRLERAGGTPHLVEEFRQGLLRLALFSTDGPNGLHCMRLDKTLEYLKEHCAEPLRLPRVARRAGFSVPTFSRAFKRATGTSFARYVRGLRVARAGELLRTTQLSGERIAELCGFRNQHHLIRSFKQVTGVTPGAFRSEASRDERC